MVLRDRKRYVDSIGIKIQGAYSIKHSILYGIGPLDSNSIEVKLPLPVAQHRLSESLQQSKWRCVLWEIAREPDDGRTTDRRSLLYGLSFSHRAGTSLTQVMYNEYKLNVQTTSSGQISAPHKFDQYKLYLMSMITQVSHECITMCKGYNALTNVITTLLR
jgi:hypothetical protein